MRERERRKKRGRERVRKGERKKRGRGEEKRKGGEGKEPFHHKTAKIPPQHLP